MTEFTERDKMCKALYGHGKPRRLIGVELLPFVYAGWQDVNGVRQRTSARQRLVA
jgi:hypothetical protein